MKRISVTVLLVFFCSDLLVMLTQVRMAHRPKRKL